MLLIKFYKNIIRSYIDLSDHISMLIHSISSGCNLKCFECFNYNDLIKNPPSEYYTEEDIYNIIKRQGFMFDAIILSGGEFLLENIENIIEFLNNIRYIYDGKIVIYTNGTNPEKVKTLLNKKLVDGFHVDMKLPFHLLDIEQDKEIFYKILGIQPSKKIIDKMLKTIEIVIKDNSPYSQIRTVRYPILTDDFFNEIKLYIDDLKRKYNSQIQYKLNDFIKE